MARNKRNSVRYDGKTFYEEQIPLLEKYNALLEERDRLEKNHVSSLGKQADILDEIEKKTANTNAIRKTGLNLSSEQTKDIINQLNNQKKLNEEQERGNTTILGGIKSNLNKNVFNNSNPFNFNSIGSDLITYGVYNKSYKQISKSNPNMAQEQVIKLAQEKAANTLNEGADKFTLAAGIMQGVANTFKDGFGIITKLFNTGFNKINSSYESVATGVAARTGTTTSQQLNNIKQLNNNLGGWFGSSSLRDNVKSSDVINYTQTLANIGTGYSNEQLYARALEDVVTKTIVPYLDTGSVLWQQLVDYQPDLQKNIRGINKINQEIAGNNYATEKILNNILNDLAPVSEAATGDLAMNAAGASDVINTLMGSKYNMTEDQAIAYYKQWYKQKYQGSTVLESGSVADKYSYINNLKNGVNLNDVVGTIGANLQNDQDLSGYFGVDYSSNESSLRSSYYDQLINGGNTAKSIYFSASGKGYGLDFSDVTKNGYAAEAGVKDAGNAAYNEFANGDYQTAKDKQETYMENMTNDVASIYSSLGYWGDLIVSGIKNLGTVLITWGTTKLIGGIIGKGIGSLAGVSGASTLSSSAGLGSLLGTAGPIVAGVAAVAGTAYLIDKHIQKRTDEEHTNTKEGIKQSAQASMNAGTYSNQNAATYNAIDKLYTGQYYKKYSRKEMKDMGFNPTLRENRNQEIVTGYNERKSSGQVYDANKAVIAQILNLDKHYGTKMASGNYSQDYSREDALLAAAILLDKNNMLKDSNVFSYVPGNFSLNSKSDIRSMLQDLYKNGKNVTSGIDNGQSILNQVGISLIDSKGNAIPVNITTDELADYSGIAKDQIPKSYTEKYHRQGLDEVPYDNYPALLHEGEAVLTASTADQLRGLLDEYRTTNNQSISFDTIIQEQTTALITKLDQLINVVQTNNTTSNISKASSLSNNMAYNMIRIKNLATFNNR